ncbi:hypothetical protein [Clostridium botulinum]|uniref:hypothetical protein n=1 Tax=Clostridium botulinum TaxID=1491 RepID=UPI0002075951|nr:hypothetical protein [Clostridium botulinum]AEB75170.1 putative hypothetical protein [Clostridium botulinum BKT015925]MCD3196889.1 hypothetical protein [Clostridium botulinum C/D]MCD3201747.1 hypothetical protein [Clostridium botulinum C/D]MCD3210123.1 hypothetical protein [Clostridium botulinum C/D]MCD3213564.1 hypothetical protein [Clostridium botulinum C/D]
MNFNYTKSYEICLLTYGTLFTTKCIEIPCLAPGVVGGNDGTTPNCCYCNYPK